jgi:DNA-binding MarR family transcriptional regulator
MIHGLVSCGWIERPDSADDHRRLELRLTVRGNTLINRVRGEPVAKFAQRFEKISPVERGKVLSELDLIRGLLEEREENPAE